MLCYTLRLRHFSKRQLLQSSLVAALALIAACSAKKFSTNFWEVAAGKIETWEVALGKMPLRKYLTPYLLT